MVKPNIVSSQELKINNQINLKCNNNTSQIIKYRILDTTANNANNINQNIHKRKLSRNEYFSKKYIKNINDTSHTISDQLEDTSKLNHQILSDNQSISISDIYPRLSISNKQSISISDNYHRLSISDKQSESIRDRKRETININGHQRQELNYKQSPLKSESKNDYHHKLSISNKQNESMSDGQREPININGHQKQEINYEHNLSKSESKNDYHHKLSMSNKKSESLNDTQSESISDTQSESIRDTQSELSYRPSIVSICDDQNISISDQNILNQIIDMGYFSNDSTSWSPDHIIRDQCDSMRNTLEIDSRVNYEAITNDFGENERQLNLQEIFTRTFNDQLININNTTKNNELTQIQLSSNDDLFPMNDYSIYDSYESNLYDDAFLSNQFNTNVVLNSSVSELSLTELLSDVDSSMSRIANSVVETSPNEHLSSVNKSIFPSVQECSVTELLSGVKNSSVTELADRPVNGLISDIQDISTHVQFTFGENNSATELSSDVDDSVNERSFTVLDGLQKELFTSFQNITTNAMYTSNNNNFATRIFNDVQDSTENNKTLSGIEESLENELFSSVHTNEWLRNIHDTSVHTNETFRDVHDTSVHTNETLRDVHDIELFSTIPGYPLSTELFTYVPDSSVSELFSGVQGTTSSTDWSDMNYSIYEMGTFNYNNSNIKNENYFDMTYLENDNLENNEISIDINEINKSEQCDIKKPTNTIEEANDLIQNKSNERLANVRKYQKVNTNRKNNNNNENLPRNFQCTYLNCLKFYAKMSHLKAHLRRHSGERSFKCDWNNCQWKFSRSDELSRHKRSHFGIKPYPCTICIKKFTRSDHLAKHLKVHERQKYKQLMKNSKKIKLK